MNRCNGKNADRKLRKRGYQPPPKNFKIYRPGIPRTLKGGLKIIVFSEGFL